MDLFQAFLLGFVDGCLPLSVILFLHDMPTLKYISSNHEQVRLVSPS